MFFGPFLLRHPDYGGRMPRHPAACLEPSSSLMGISTACQIECEFRERPSITSAVNRRDNARAARRGPRDLFKKRGAVWPHVGLSRAIVLPISVPGHQWASTSTDE